MDITLENIWSRIHKTKDNCWLYNNKASSYGSINGRPAHRVMYEILEGPIPKNMHVHHLCFVKGCINPKHLLVVTPAKNTQLGSFSPYYAAKVGRGSYRPNWVDLDNVEMHET